MIMECVKVARLLQGFDNQYCMIHCSAGVGRSGAFVALDYAMHQAEAQGKVDILKIVNLLRQDRAGAVSSFLLYEWLHEAM